MRVTLLSTISLFLLTFVQPRASGSKAVDYRLDVSFDPANSFIQAVAVIKFDSTAFLNDTVHFYLHGELTVDSLFANGKVQIFEQTSVFYESDYSLIATRVAFYPEVDRKDQISIHYSGYFNKSKARSPSDYMRIDEDGVFLRSFGYSLWFPIFLEAKEDSYATNFTEVVLRTPLAFIPVFTGDKISEELSADKRVSRWRAMQTDLFHAQCTAQKFVVFSGEKLFLYHSADSASAVAARDVLAFVRDLAARFQATYGGNGSTAQMHVMEMPRFGDISSGNVTGISAGIWKDFAANEWSKRGLAHELVHSYVNSGTKRDDSLFALAIEGFPSYFHLPILAEFFGESWYNQVMRQTEEEYLKKKRTGLGWRDRPVPREIALTAISADEVGVYKDAFVLDDRALLFLNWLYQQMGRERFFSFARELFDSPSLTFESFRLRVLKYLPLSADDLSIWLSTTDYPERFLLETH